MQKPRQHGGTSASNEGALSISAPSPTLALKNTFLHGAVRFVQPIRLANTSIRINCERVWSHLLVGSFDDLELPVALALTDLRLQPDIEVVWIDPDQALRRHIIFDANSSGYIADLSRSDILQSNFLHGFFEPVFPHVNGQISFFHVVVGDAVFAIWTL